MKAKELKKGVKVEAEHTKGKLFAQKKSATKRKELQSLIAKDHLKEIPDYYTRLGKMEKAAKKKKK